ncbi:hypothetical protein [Tenacibaculum maritimum]|uniref:hypothetical protein n=1 Tax=Tenacibaculum maritimum TaxID=107401 RepID=UPI0012E4079A|nr:hypothetical protein [Tenacibaculum maritimum]CAA0156957.1 hypothetical protein CVI1001048_100040 [Tenacibaculum maritimum]
MNLEEIQALKTMYLKTLTPLEEYNKEVSEVKMKVGSYAELIELIGAIINVSQSAMEGMCNFDIPHCSEYDIISVLGVAKDLLPYSEANFLDKIKGNRSIELNEVV